MPGFRFLLLRLTRELTDGKKEREGLSVAGIGRDIHIIMPRLFVNNIWPPGDAQGAKSLLLSTVLQAAMNACPCLSVTSN